jgi:hypothetical protein
VSGLPHINPRPADDEPPPIMGSWRRIYIFVLCYLALLIAGFYVFTRVFAS